MANYTISKIKLPNGDICNIKDTTYTAGNGINIDNNNKINWDWKIISERNPYLYKYSQTYTTTIIPTEDWYVEIILNKQWSSELTPLVITSSYSNIGGMLYLELDSFSDLFKAYRTTYNGCNILAIKRVAVNGISHIYLQLQKPVEYNNTIPQGTITIYSPVSITSIAETTNQENMYTLVDGYNSNTHFKASGFEGSGASLTNLNASNISNGTLSTDRLPTIPQAKLPVTLTSARLISTEQMTFSSWKPTYLVSGNSTRVPAKTMALYADGIAITNPTTNNDAGWLRVVGTSESDTVLELATGDDAGTSTSETIAVRQYNTSTLKYEAILLGKINDVYGATSFPVQVSAPKFIGSLVGNADTATAFSTNKSITLTGDVTGSASSTGGWSIATTIGNGKVTNAMLAGSIANEKLTNSSITIGNKTVNLGGSITLADLGLSQALKFRGITNVVMNDGYVGIPTIPGLTYTPTVGDVVIDSSSNSEYVCISVSGTTYTWEHLGRDDSFKLTQTQINDPTANGTATSFISTISQNENGNITATKANLPDYLSTISWDATNKKLTQTIYNQSPSDVITASTLKTAMELNNVSNNEKLNNISGTKGDIIYWSATNTPAHLTNTSSTTKQALTITSQVPSWTNISPNITIGAGTDSAAPTVNVTVLGVSGTAQSITTASTSAYGVTKLNDEISSNSTTLAATANAAYTASRNSLHTLGTTTRFYLTGCSSNTTNTAGDIFDTGIYSTTTAGELSAVRHTLNLNGTDKAYMVWNDTDQSIDFVFN